MLDTSTFVSSSFGSLIMRITISPRPKILPFISRIRMKAAKKISSATPTASSHKLCTSGEILFMSPPPLSPVCTYFYPSLHQQWRYCSIDVQQPFLDRPFDVRFASQRIIIDHDPRPALFLPASALRQLSVKEFRRH